MIKIITFGGEFLMKRYGKKIVSFVLVFVISITMIVPVLANGEISVYLDNEQIQFDVAPLLVNGRTMVPMRAIFEKLGAVVYWDDETWTAVANKGNVNVSIAIDDTTLYKNGEAIVLDVPAQLNSGRTLVPLRAVSEAFDCDVQWNGDTQTVNIYSTVSNQEESIYIEPPKNIRVVRQQNGSAHIQWDKVEGAEYYHFYYQEAGEDTFWFDEDDNGEKLKFEYCDDYTVSYNGLENGKIYNVIVTSVKNGVESNDSEIFTFIYDSSASQEDAFNALKAFILENQNGNFNGSDPSYTVKRNDESAYLWEYTLVYEEAFNTITVKERIIYENQQNSAFMQLRSDDIPCLCMFVNDTLYNYSDSLKFTGTYTIDPNTFTKNSTIVFSEVEGNAFDYEYYADLAKYMNLDMLNFLDFIYHTDLRDTGCSIIDFGFNL